MALILLYSFLSVKTIFSDGIIPGWDNPVHYVHAYRTAIYMFPQLNILGWDPFNQFGWVFNLYYNPGISILISLVYHMLLGTMSVLTVYKIIFFLAYFLMAPAVFLFIKALTGDREAALLASLFSVTVFAEESEWLDAGLKQMYYLGMWPERFGLVFAFLGIGLSAYSFKSKSPRKTLLLIALSSLMFSMAILTHVMIGFSAAFMATIFWLFTSLSVLRVFFSSRHSRDVKSMLKTEAILLLKFASIGLLSMGMVAFWMIPLLQTVSTYHSFPAIIWSIGPEVFLETFTSMPWYILLPYIIGAFSYASNKEGFFYSSVASTTVIILLQILAIINLNDGCIGLKLLSALIASLILLVSSNNVFISFSLASVSFLGLLSTGPSTYLIPLGSFTFNLLDIIPFARSFGYSKFNAPARILIFCLSATGFSKICKKLYSASKKPRFSAAYSAVVGLLVFFILNMLVNTQLQNTDLAYPFSKNKVFKLTSDYPGFSKVDRLLEWVRENASANTYMLLQDTLDLGYYSSDFQNSHYVYTASLVIGRPVIGGCFGTNYITNPYANSEGGYLLGFPVGRLITEEDLLPRLMDELGVGYLAVHDPRMIAALNLSPIFKIEYYDGLYAVFRKTNFTKIASIIGEGLVDSVSFEINRISLRVKDVKGNSSYLIVRQVNFPWFTAKVNGKTVPIETYYPKLPSTLSWQWAQTVYNWRIPFMKIKLPDQTRDIVLEFRIHTVGDEVSQISWLIFMSLLALYSVLLLRGILIQKWRK
ncbi:MAG: hypothetical protein ACUVQ0_03945 [Thermoproteota archaeon]